MKIYFTFVIVAILIIINRFLKILDLPNYLYSLSYFVAGTCLFVVYYINNKKVNK